MTGTNPSKPPKETPEARRRRDLRRRYNITPEEYDEMLHAQGGGCAVCGVGTGRAGRALVVDHCHSTDIVRGILCDRCNTLIGRLEKNRGLLPVILKYLAR